MLLAGLLFPVKTRQYRFRGSVVTEYPLFLDRHVRDPLFDICNWTVDFIEAHSISRAVAWMRANVAVPPLRSVGVPSVSVSLAHANETPVSQADPTKRLPCDPQADANAGNARPNKGITP